MLPFPNRDAGVHRDWPADVRYVAAEDGARIAEKGELGVALGNDRPLAFIRVQITDMSMDLKVGSMIRMDLATETWVMVFDPSGTSDKNWLWIYDPSGSSDKNWLWIYDPSGSRATYWV